MTSARSSRAWSHPALPFFILSASVLLIGLLSVPISTYLTLKRVYLNRPLTWSPPPHEHVALRIIPGSSHYEMGSEAWDKLLPLGGHVVHLREPDGSIKTYTVAMFHQLRCVEILHRAYVDEGSHRTSPPVQSCLNYLRQTMLCAMDTRNEPQGAVYTHNGFETLCYDWEGIFREAERNHEEFHRYSLDHELGTTLDY
ncbi:hypothetical protein BV25DRAFT_1827925 [Artomyces pyxidatus]|uniref:Uncharacterized protein n=1 Tax=Artomyces pyxidatus TaxID=48021 RepID=A0ACB8SV00_9AGAM|nr:hypothetical protein BV25DRAFT_1827925 [Artomyces pyxidatus]